MAEGPEAATGQAGSERQSGAGRQTSGAAATFRLAAVATIALIVLSGLGALLIEPSPYYPKWLVFLTLFSAQRQDLPVAAGIMAVLALIAFRPALVPLARIPPLRPLLVLSAALLLVGAIWLLRIGALFDHDLTRDEHMAVFDATIFGSGRLFWPFPAALRSFYAPLNDLFLFPIGNREGLVSNYLPINAGIRALAGQIMPLSLVSPVLAGLGGIALWRIAVRLWPDEGATHAVILLCYAASSQVILTGTAAFAMTTHLALNLIWLALFLRQTRTGHAGALAVGFLATGIHQPVFHPLFVLPFLDLLRREGRWRTLAIYVLGYLVIGLTWLAWPHWLTAHGIGIAPEGPPEQFSFVGRLAAVLTPPNFDALWIMAANLLRFVAWQHLLLVPLALVGVYRCAGRDNLARALALGVLLTIIAMTILLPPQGHGWGYRYLHGFIGSLCLLAGFGWRWLSTNGGVPLRAMKLATALSLLIVLPLHTWMVRGMIEPYARAAQAFARVDADYLIVDSDTVPFGTNFVVNRPDLSNRPRLILGHLLYPWDIAQLCPGRTIAFVDAPQFAATYRYYGDPVPKAPSPLQQLQKRIAGRTGCRVIAAPVR